MKKFTLYLMLCMVANSFAQNNDNFEFWAPTYKKLQTCVTSFNCSFNEYVFNVDTVINGKTYTKITLNGSFFAGFREDDVLDSIFVITPQQQTFGMKRLRNLAVGDTVRWYPWQFKLFWNLQSWSNSTFQVDTVVSVTNVAWSNRSLRIYKTKQVPFPNSTSLYADVEYHQGVGIQKFKLPSNGSVHVDCFYQNSRLRLTTIFAECDFDGNYVSTKPIHQAVNYLYPNPSNGNVQYQVSDMVNLDLRDITGKLIKSYSLQGSGNLDLTYLNKGVYFLHNPNNNSSQKIVIQ